MIGAFNLEKMIDCVGVLKNLSFSKSERSQVVEVDNDEVIDL